MQFKFKMKQLTSNKLSFAPVSKAWDKEWLGDFEKVKLLENVGDFAFGDRDLLFSKLLGLLGETAANGESAGGVELLNLGGGLIETGVTSKSIFSP